MNVKKESEKSGLKLNIQKMKIMASSSITSWQKKREKAEAMTDFIFLGSKITAAMKLKGTYSLEEKHIKKQRRYFANKDPSSQSYSFSNSHVQMWELDIKEGWAFIETSVNDKKLTFHFPSPHDWSALLLCW